MALHYNTQGFILKKRNAGEADRIFTVFTKDFGKVSILGKAIRKISSKLKGGIDVLYLSDLEFIQGKNQKTLTDVINIEKFKEIRKDFLKLKMAHRIIDVVSNLINGEEKDENVWKLILEVFERLNGKKPYNSLLYQYFFWNFISILGYKPELYKCSACQSNLKQWFLNFSPKEGGVICSSCAKGDGRVNSDSVKIIRIILNKDLNTLEKLKVSPSSKRILASISHDYYIYLLNIHPTD